MNRKKSYLSIIFFAFAFCLTAFVAGCSYLSMSREDNTATRPNFYGGERNLTYNCAVIKGKVISPDVVKKPNLLIAYPLRSNEGELNDYILLNSTSPFMLYLSEGRYHLYTLTDFNNDGFYTQDEVSGVYGSLSSPREITLRKEGLIKDVEIYASQNNSGKIVFPREISIDEKQARNQLTYSGQVSKIYDEKFSLQNGSAGWWNPTAFMKAFGARIYFMEEYDPKKIPVLFVHGAEGSPQNWVYFLMRLDRSRYQPWFFYYPSGIHLSLSSQLLYDELMELHARHGFKNMCIVAHSIGGLVTRSLLTTYKFDKQNNFIKVYVTLATPWSGFEMADASQKYQHKSLPSWMDIGAQSVFIRRTMNAKLPRNIRYYLFYGKNDMVCEGRALDERAVSDARQTFSFDCDHNSILSDRHLFRKFKDILQKDFY
ncbi:MAG TPA: alpha/beta hydrolase [Deltaproteobacteria bacterium]|nr:alpha/beta hydrolase [Deltaproteobacteria bacterium]